jgi:hypothetical protein
MAASAADKKRMRAARDVLGGVTVVSMMLCGPLAIFLSRPLMW